MIKNFTPHPIVVVSSEGVEIKRIESSGLIRLKAETVDTGVEIDGVKITKTQFGEPVGLPDFEDGIFIIVSQLVKSALPHRRDLLVPAEVVRDSQGNILGCQSLGA